MRKQIIKLLCFTTIMSCKPFSPDSDLKHEWGNTSRNGDGFRYVECQKMKNNRFPETSKLLEETAFYLMEKNSRVFNLGSALDPKNFCFYIQDYVVGNAFAEVPNRAIKVTTGLVNEISDLEEFAFVVSHELAHISMQHYMITHPDYNPSPKYRELKKVFDFLTKSKASEEYSQTSMNLMKCLKNLGFESHETRMKAYEYTSSVFCRENTKDPSVCQALSSNYKNEYVDLYPAQCKNQARINIEKNEEYAKWNKVAVDHNTVALYKEMVEEVSKDPKFKESSFNWFEREADDVGSEFYYRSGFDRNKILGFLSYNALKDTAFKNSSYTPEACIDFANSSPNLPELVNSLDNKLSRGSKSHPEPCWRLLHLVYETQIHKEDIDALSSGNHTKIESLRKQFEKAKKEVSSK